MFTTNSFACYRHLDLRSREKDVELKIPRSIAYVFTHAQYSNRWRSRVPNLRGAPGGQNRDIHLTFLGPRLQCGYQVPPRDVTTRCYVMITKPRCARQLMKWKSSKPSLFPSIAFTKIIREGYKLGKPCTLDVNDCTLQQKLAPTKNS